MVLQDEPGLVLPKPTKFSIDMKIMTLQTVHPFLVLFPSRPFNFIRFLVKFVVPRFSLFLLRIQVHIANLSSKVWFLGFFLKNNYKT